MTATVDGSPNQTGALQHLDGGHCRIWQQTDDGDLGGFECELLELDPPRRIVFRWGFVGPARTAGPVFDSLLTITLSEAPGSATQLTLVHERPEELRAAKPDVAEGVEPGWASVLDKLADAIQQADRWSRESPPTHPPEGSDDRDPDAVRLPRR